MADYPEDVMEAAREVAENLYDCVNQCCADWGFDADKAASVIASAIMAERERCAMVADQLQHAARQEKRRTFAHMPDAYASMLLVEQAADEIAAAIRGGS